MSRYMIVPAILVVMAVGLVPLFVLINYSVQTPYEEKGNFFVGFDNFKEVDHVPGLEGSCCNGGLFIIRNPKLILVEMRAVERIADRLKILHNDSLECPSMLRIPECDVSYTCPEEYGETCDYICCPFEKVHPCGFDSLNYAGDGIQVSGNRE